MPLKEIQIVGQKTARTRSNLINKKILFANNLRNPRKLLLPEVRCLPLIIGVFLFCEFLSYPVYAHAFGQRYDLPLPLSFFMVGGGLAVLVSFVIMAIAAKSKEKSPHGRK